jgi:GDP-L-fucose synthase
LRVFLSGGGGLVGRNFLAAALDGFEVWAPSRAELDLLDAQAVGRALEQFRPDVVVHAAGLVGGIQANIREPLRFLLANLEMGVHLVKAAKATGVRRLLNLGSSCMYPRDHSAPLREEEVLAGPLEATNEGYAIAKITVARLCQYLRQEDSRFAYKTLIPCNLYGRFDHFDPAKSHMVAAILHKLHQAKVQGQHEVEIWGDGMARREFMYAADLADCMWRALAHFDSLPDTMNVGLGEDWTVNTYYETAAEVVGYRGRFVHDLSKPVGMARKLVDVSRAKAWGWQARTSLREGLSLTYEHYLERVNPLGLSSRENSSP